MHSSPKNDPPCELQPIGRAESLTTKVQDALVELIIERVLVPGQHIVESEIARQLGVSRQPVREALRDLHVHGWVELRQGRGAFVHQPTETEISDILRVRNLLGTEAARVAATRATPEEVEQMRTTSKHGHRAQVAGDLRTAVQDDAHLHGLIAKASGNAFLFETHDKLSRRARWYLQPVVEQRGDVIWHEHDEIVEAISAGEAETAGALMAAHTDITLQLMIGAFADAGSGATSTR